ncbi:hypothetical protein ASF66_00545 [Pseudomonas sp. Leaf129]|nr:hypothetical protein ASF66_00545 [Pseudomonas sp. Leaf129]
MKPIEQMSQKWLRTELYFYALWNLRGNCWAQMHFCDLLQTIVSIALHHSLMQFFMGCRLSIRTQSEKAMMFSLGQHSINYYSSPNLPLQ